MNQDKTNGRPTGGTADVYPTPGAPEARARGCTCDPAKNWDGAGEVEGTVFHTDLFCPLHGLAAILEPPASRGGCVG